MPSEKIRTWCDEHINIKHTLIPTERGFKVEFENGETYEYRVAEWGRKRRRTQVYINGNLEGENIYERGMVVCR